MSYFPGVKLTELGEQLLAKINSNLSETITFKRAEIGSGVITSDEEIKKLTSLKAKWKDASISDCKIVGKNKTQVRLEVQFDNVGLTTNKIFREIGIYASGKDGREVLFAYSNAKENYDYIPPASDNPQSFIIGVLTTITANTKVSAIIDLNSYVTTEKFLGEINKKLDKGNVSTEYNTAEKIEKKIKEVAKTAENAGSSANEKLDKGSVSTEYNTAEKIEKKIKEKLDKTGGTITGNITTQGDLTGTGTKTISGFGKVYNPVWG